MPSVEESDVGILCYVSDLPGFCGVLKQRYSDFIVNEVDLDGQVVHLTSLEVPSEIAGQKIEERSDPLNADYSLDIESFRELAGDSDVEKLKGFLEQIVAEPHSNDSCIVLSPSSDKAYRTAIHNFFKERLKFLVTDTVDGPDCLSKCVRVWLKSGNNSGRKRDSRKRKSRDDKPFDCRGSDIWPEHGKFLRFHLYKENKDTMEALGLLGKMLGIQLRSFGFAGTKDKRGVTTQKVTVFKQRANKLANLNERLIGIKLGNFCYVHDGLALGQLQGNQFTITLRSISAETIDIIGASTAALGKTGFINYFGLQRFGSGSIPTHLIGAALLRGHWRTAVNMILDPRDGEKDATSKVRKYYKETGDIGGTLRQLPHHMVAERAILSCLQKSPGNYLQALLGIPRTLRMMFVHSYQSFLWNHAASMRVKNMMNSATEVNLLLPYVGVHKVVAGDLVCCNGQETLEESTFSHFECEDGSSNEIRIDSLLDDAAAPNHSKVNDASVKVVSEEDIVAERYTIYDLVLPLPGSRITYPSNDIQEVYHVLAENDNVKLNECAHKSKEFSFTNITGAYRKVFQKPKDYKWELLSYTDSNIPLAETDWDVISKSHANSSAKSSDGMNDKIKLSEGMDSLNQPKESGVASDLQESSQMALKLTFTLPASCYATMAIRELLKSSTSVAFHKALSSQSLPGET